MFVSLLCGIFSGVGIKITINYLAIDAFKLSRFNFLLEILCALTWVWAFQKLPFNEAIIFASIVSILLGISIVDYYTFQIPFLFIVMGVMFAIAGIYFNLIYFSSALWGIFVGAIIPLIIMGLTWMITKRQGMGFGDIQLGIVLGLWLGPMRMAITLFGASVLSLLTWVAVSIIHEFDKDRALPMAPFLAIAGIGVYIGSIYFPGFFHLLIIQ